MKKLWKRLDLVLVFVITLITCSGCFKVGGESNAIGEVELVSAPSTTTIRFMNESLYIGYLGAQRDFALLVDNGGYNLTNKTQNCGVDEKIGCSSTFAKLVMNYGIKTSNFTGESGAENLLIYYTTSTDFDKFGSPGDNWYQHLTSSGFNNSEYSDFEDNDVIRSLSCGTSGVAHSYICDYSKELSTKGYSNGVGNAMLLLFNNGDLYDVVTDHKLDPEGKLNRAGTKLDDLVVTNSNSQMALFEEYYEAIVPALSSLIRVSNATHTSATSSGSRQKVQNLETIAELEDLIAGRKGVDDYLLFITSTGFINEKVGVNYDYDGVGDDSLTGGVEDTMTKTISLMLNSVSSFTDNCASESEPMLNFLKGILKALLAGGAGALIGVAAGAGVGALIGSVIPGVGTAIGAGVGAIVGGIIGFFAGLAINDKIEDKLKTANGISDKSYCKIVASALNDVEINVPIYTYNIDTAKDNVKAYRDNTMSDTTLKNYYAANSNKCLNQYVEIAVPDSLMSFFTPKLDSKYSYADICQKELVSNIVGGFGGSPSLQLYLNGKKADDLYGRVTTELVNEMLSVWGLKTVGDLYTLASKGTRNEMSVTFASAQALDANKLEYCISESQIPTCDGASKYEVIDSDGTDNLSDGSYVQSFNTDQGITLEFTDMYMEYSYAKTKAIFNNSTIDDLTLNTYYSQDKVKKYNRRDVNLNSNWEQVEIGYGLEADEAAFDQLVEKVKQTLKDNRENMYQIGYNGNYYVICADGSVVGYNINSSGNVSVIYYCDGDYEYIFAGTKHLTDDSEIIANDTVGAYVYLGNYYTIDLKNDVNADIDSGHEFYVYISYVISSTGEQAYYSYII